MVLGDAAVGGHPHPAMFAVSLVCGAIGLTGAVLAARRGPDRRTPDADQGRGVVPAAGFEPALAWT